MQAVSKYQLHHLPSGGNDAANPPDDSGDSSGEPGTDEVQYYNITLSEEPATLNHLINTTVAGGYILVNILEPLVRNEYGNVVPAGCSSYDISEDGLTWTFHLRENYWNDGEQVTAEHYAYTLRMCATPSTGYPYAADMYVIKNFEAVVSGEKDVSELGVKAVDDLTLEISLEYVCPALLKRIQCFVLSLQNLSVLP